MRDQGTGGTRRPGWAPGLHFRHARNDDLFPLHPGGLARHGQPASAGTAVSHDAVHVRLDGRHGRWSVARLLHRCRDRLEDRPAVQVRSGLQCPGSLGADCVARHAFPIRIFLRSGFHLRIVPTLSPSRRRLATPDTRLIPNGFPDAAPAHALRASGCRGRCALRSYAATRSAFGFSLCRSFLVLVMPAACASDISRCTGRLLVLLLS